MRHQIKWKKLAGLLILIAFAAFSIGSLIFIKMNFDDTFERVQMRELSAFLRYSDVKDEYDRELLSFPSGKNQLQGYLYGAENSKGLVVISHGLGGGAEGYLAETLYFADLGYQVFCYDNTGCCQSEGENCVGLSQSVIDLDAALTYIEQEKRFENLPVLLYGHSWGGYADTAIFNYDHNIAASVSVSGFNKPMEMILEWIHDSMGAFSYAEYPYIYLYQLYLFGKNANMSAVSGINRTDTSILIVHGTGDTAVGYETAGIIAYRDSITNPNVQYKICDQERQNGHNNLFQSLEAQDYYEAMDPEYEKLYEKYDGEIPREEEDAFFAQIDKRKMSGLDENFMEDVAAFYADACK